MSWGTTIWNTTEYLCYLAIIFQTGLTLFGIFISKDGQARGGLMDLVNDASKIVHGLANQMDQPAGGAQAGTVRRRK